ncbi:uncharacterized protein LOC132383487 [Hypanus sabinus]|uniref:uncharacterized protein LOC132383487 n=1 Tax=Hypanus sabinus TaxID=79690 RepID=UPI0028C4852B|nr:uncharacterized protein LOC132383487 [Hypanus sabinus]
MMPLKLLYAYMITMQIFIKGTSNKEHHSFLLLNMNWWLTLLSIFCIGEMLLVIFVEIRAFLVLWNTVRKWKKWRKDQILREEVHCHSCWPQEEINLKRKIVAVDLIKDYYFLDWWHTHDCIVLTFLFAVVCTHLIALGLTGNIKMLCQHLIALSFIPLWLKNMKHLRALRVIGPFIVTIARMMTDVAKFLFLYFEFFFAFAYSIWLMLGGTSELRTLDEALFFIFRISVQDQWQLGDTADEDRVLAYIIIGTYISITSFLCFSMFTALFSNTYMRIHENSNVDVLMQRVSIILQAEKRWCIFLHQDKCRDFILKECAPLKVRYKKKEKHWNENVFPLRETKADKEARLSELALKIKEMLRDCTSIATGIPNKDEEESRTNLQSRQQSKNKKLVVLQKDLWRLQQGLEVLQSQQEILDMELQEVMDKLLEKAQRMCEVYHNRGLTDRVLTKEEYQHSQSIEFFLRKKIQSVNHYLGSQGVENINQHNQQLSEYQSD